MSPGVERNDNVSLNCDEAPLAVIVLLCLAGTAHAQPSSQSQLEELKRLSIEELAETDVTGSGRRPEQLDHVASAVSVITGDDLRRYGVMNLPGAAAGGYDARGAGGGTRLRDQPAWFQHHHGEQNAGDDRWPDRLSPVFAGVFWEAQDLIIADIDRIEIVRGPGGTLWGANAVNGVIHVITKHAAETRGTFVNAALGTNTLGPFAVRHGGRFGNAGSYRVYAKAREEDGSTLVSGGEAGNDHRFGQVGFRVESERRESSFAVLQGDLFSGNTGLSDDRAISLNGANLLARWTGRTSSGAETTVQAYCDHFYRRVPARSRGSLHTLDLDAQQLRRFGRHHIVFGGGYRQYRGDDLGDGPGILLRAARARLASLERVRTGGARRAPRGLRHRRNQARTQRIHRRRIAADRGHPMEQRGADTLGRRVQSGARADAIRYRSPLPDPEQHGPGVDRHG